MWNKDKLTELVLMQLKNFFYVSAPEDFKDYVERARIKLLISCQGVRRGFEPSDISPYNTGQWAVFLYYLSHEVYIDGKLELADQIYYLNKIMNSVDWYSAIELPEHFFVEHPVGSILGRAKYSDYLFVYQGVTIGGNRSNDKLYYPIIGGHVLLYANTTIIGKAEIGNYVICSANTYIKDEIIPDYSIVFGQSPNLIIKTKNEQEIKGHVQHLWQ